METISVQFIKEKKVLLRLDLDVLVDGRLEEFRLKAGLPTLKLCLENSSNVVILGHLGRPNGVEVPELSVAPIYEWLKNRGYSGDLGNGRLVLLENLRFERGEDESNMEYAHSIIDLVDPGNKGDVVFVNEAFAAHHPAASTTILPKLLPHAAGLRFAEEVRVLREVRNPPAGGSKRPLVAIIGGLKIEDKGPAIEALSKIANTVLVGGKIALELTGPAGSQPHSMSSLSLRALNGAPRSPSPVNIQHNVLVGSLTEDGLDIAIATLDLWEPIIEGAAQIIWNGPVGKVTNEVSHLASAEGTYKLAKMILESKADIIIGGGDTVGFLGKLGLLGDFEKKGFVSTGGGAMLKFLIDGTLPTIEALE